MSLPYLYSAQYPPRDRPMPQPQQHHQAGPSQSLGQNQSPNRGSRQMSNHAPACTQKRRGKKPFDLPPDVEEGLVRFLDYLDIPFEDIAKAVQKSKGGPGKGKLRKWFQGIAGTMKPDHLRLRNDKEASKERRAVQESFINGATASHYQIQGDAQPLHLETASYRGPNTPSNRNYAEPGHFATNGLESESEPNNIEENRVANWLGLHEGAIEPPQRQDTLDTGFSNIVGADFATMADVAGRCAEPPLEESGLEIRPLVRSVTFADPPSGDTMNDASLAFDSHQSWPMKRQKTVESDGDEVNPSYSKRRKLVQSLSLTSIANHLVEITGDNVLIRHYARKASMYAETIASASIPSPWSSRSPTFCGAYRADVSIQSVVFVAPQAPTEYEEFYHNPGPNEGQRGNAFRTRAHMRDLASISAPSLVVEARLQKMSDEDAFEWLNELLSTTAEQRAWVNGRDERGVSALHLTVAFGFLKSSHLLCEHGADRKAKTTCGTSVHKFAKPAQNLAKKDPALLHRIIVCREFIRRNKAPPMPKADNKGSSTNLNEETPPSASSTNRRMDSRAMTSQSSAYSEDVTQYPVPVQDEFCSGMDSLNAEQGHPWVGGGLELGHGLSLSPVSISRRQGSMNSNDFSLDRSRAAQDSDSLRKAVGRRNLNRTMTMAPAQQNNSQVFNPAAQPRFSRVAPNPSTTTYLHPSATQSVPNLGHYGPALAAAASESVYHNPPFTSLSAVTVDDQSVSTTPSAAGPSTLNNTFGGSGANQTSTTSNVPALPETAALLGFGGSTPLSLAPQMMHSMQTYNKDHQYQAFPCWTENGQASVQPTIQPTPPQQSYANLQRPRAPRTHHLGLPPGLAPTNPQQLGTLAPMVPLDATGANGYPPSARNTWFTCHHNEPVSYERSDCHTCLALSQM